MQKIQLISLSANQTKDYARQIILANPDCRVIFLQGKFGAGKTTFVQGLSDFFGTDQINVKSPTFAFCEDHGKWVHYDLYRLESLDDITEALIFEQLQQGKYIVIEWPELVMDLLKVNHVKVQIEHVFNNISALDQFGAMDLSEQGSQNARIIRYENCIY